jgi:DNA helicase-2/ATP-dependent DNA helicase PcrA
MEDGIFPSAQNLFDKEAMSEERRLAYVAITRAKEKLYISHAADRLLYGRTEKNRLSQFVREEIPKNLMERIVPKKKFPTGGVYSQMPRPSDGGMRELRRAPSLSTVAPRAKGAGGFGVERFGIGTRVSHPIFRCGTIVSAKDMGGDVLYEVRFDTGETKRLMATYAKLTKIQE